MSRQPARVIKLGGSLLDWPAWPAALRDWLARQAPAANISIVGGGPLVDQLRQLDRRHHFSPDAAHWLAIRLMSVTAAIAAELLPEARRVAALAELQFSAAAPLQILDVESFLRADENSPAALPKSWEVTSDSIAARVATVLGADEMVLLKSALPAAGSVRETWSRSGFVDAHFAHASSGLSVRCVNLRASGFPQVVE
jgi:aspartokinase-like uncharacterized kinase